MVAFFIVFLCSSALKAQTLDELKAEYRQLTNQYNTLGLQCQELSDAYDRQSEILGAIEEDYVLACARCEMQESDPDAYVDELEREISAIRYINDCIQEEIQDLENYYDIVAECFWEDYAAQDNEWYETFQESGIVDWYPLYEAVMDEIYQEILDEIQQELGFVVSDIESKYQDIESNNSYIEMLSMALDDPHAMADDLRGRYENALEIYTRLGRDYYDRLAECESARLQRTVVKMEIERITGENWDE